MHSKNFGSSNNSEVYFEGLEIGAVSVKWVRRNQDGDIITEIRQHDGDPRKTVRQILEHHKTEKRSNIVVTGQAARAFMDLPYRSETECFEKAMAFHDVKPDILLSLGGETFSVYLLKNGLVKNIISSSKCAAGTGEFIVQQFQRMDLSLENGLKVCANGRIVRLATRCSVHCKSDATHKLNKGECDPRDIARTLIHDLAKKVGEMVEAAQWRTRSLVISGGVAKNNIFIESLRQIYSESEVLVLDQSPHLEVFGASLFASELAETQTVLPPDKWIKTSSMRFDVLKPLKDAEPLLDYRVRADKENEIIEGASYILGVDAGSTTTKAVLLNVFDNSVGAACYLRTLGNPVAATKKCLNELIKKIGNKSINIIQAGATGSAREMVSVFLNNSLCFNEILAHARSAAEQVPDVDTVFEIGGQDSKFISFLKGVPIDYAMNEGCSAGTGSFLEESASVDMGISVRDISAIAEASASPIAFGERCAAFINTDLRNALQQGAGRDDVIAGLVHSIADNYISRIVGPRHIGEKLLFLGGVALNRSVALAMAAGTQRRVIVPPHPELMGSIGTALMAKDRLHEEDVSENTYILEDLVQGELEEKGTFSCRACENLCEIQKIGIREKIYPFGGLCSKYEMQRHGSEKQKESRDLIDFRNRLMFEEFGPQPVNNPLGTIGLPMALTSFELFPFYAKLINELGFNVILSKPSDKGKEKTLSSVCYPCQLVHGAVFDLLNQDVDFIFLPHLIEMEITQGSIHSYTCPSTNVIPDIIRAAFGLGSKKLLSPHISLSKDSIITTIKEIKRIGAELGLRKSFAEKAGEKALSHYLKFKKEYLKRGKKELESLSHEPTVVIAGRPYVVCDNEVNLALPRKINSRGYHVVPADILPQLENRCHPRDMWKFTQQISNSAAHSIKSPNLHICFVSCFSCGPDACVYHYFRQKLAGQTFCYLEIDSHTAHAGFETRVGAFLDIIEERKKTGAKSYA